VLPLPIDLFDEVEALWRAERERRHGPVGLVLPGGRALPRWAERGLLAGTAALIAAGITSALVVDRDPDVRRARGGELAQGPTDPSSTLGTTPAPKEPQAYLDGEDGGRIEPMIAAVQAAASARATGDRISGAAEGAATPAPPETTAATDPPPASSTTVEPQLEITAGIGPALALSLGDQCTGLSLGGQVIGCAPDPDTGVTFEGSLLP
jgi:hypothetical protein